MECEKCHRQRRSGRTYEFHYGTKGPVSYHWQLGSRAKMTPYQIAGVDGAWICDRCVNSLFGLYVAGVSLIAVLFVSLLYYFAKEGNTSNTVCWGIFVLVGLVYFVANARKVRTNFGELFAIRIKKKALRARGYNAFLTTDAYKRLR